MAREVKGPRDWRAVQMREGAPVPSVTWALRTDQNYLWSFCFSEFTLVNFS